MEESDNQTDRARVREVAAQERDAGAVETPLGQRIARILVRASVVGAAVSLLVHLIVLVVAAVIHVGGAQAGGAGRSGGEVEFAIVTEAELQQIQEAALDLGTPTISQAAWEETAVPVVLDAPGLDDSVGSGEDIGGVTEGLGGAGGDLEGLGLDIGGSGGGAATFFGVEARGLRFAYVVDISGSMSAEGGKKMASAQRELGNSIRALLEHMAFFVAFFSSEAYPIGGREKWMQANDTGKKWALARIGEVMPQGGTSPEPAFEMVFRMKPRPDAIYFMTDGNFDESAAGVIARLNKAAGKVPIHCITFEDRSAEELMRRIATESGGTYTHVEGPK